MVQAHLAPADLVPLHGGEVRHFAALKGERVLTVAALASPRPLVEQLEAVGADVELAAFPDHHEFTARQAAELRRRAAGRPIVVTLKDAVKLRSLWSDAVDALVLHQRVMIECGADLLDEALRQAAIGNTS